MAAKEEHSEEFLILLSAERFWQSGIIVNMEFNKTMNGQLFPAQAMLGILAIELYLKVISQIESGNFKRTHDLKPLFKNLTEESQKSIKSNYELKVREDVGLKQTAKAIEKASGAKVKLDFFTQLNEMRHGFVEFRYQFEGNAKGIMAINHLRNALKNRIDELGNLNQKLVRHWANSAPPR
ncbi:hypothetical protein NBRC116592_28870 [Colwellia sp. KU-HH00111]|uniref:hypothetical protein n=1 Tax=Colwellia sp. KU-HH00111 TaxID=3127652 RepID=UPI003103EA56